MTQRNFRRLAVQILGDFERMHATAVARGANATGADLRPILEDVEAGMKQLIAATEGIEPVVVKTAPPFPAGPVEPL